MSFNPKDHDLESDWLKDIEPTQEEIEYTNNIIDYKDEITVEEDLNRILDFKKESFNENPKNLINSQNIAKKRKGRGRPPGSKGLNVIRIESDIKKRLTNNPETYKNLRDMIKGDNNVFHRVFNKLKREKTIVRAEGPLWKFRR